MPTPNWYQLTTPQLHRKILQHFDADDHALVRLIFESFEIKVLDGYRSQTAVLVHKKRDTSIQVFRKVFYVNGRESGLWAFDHTMMQVIQLLQKQPA